MAGFPIPPAAYKAIEADPSWHYQLRSEAGALKSPQRHYDCLSTDEICGLRDTLGLDWILDPNCALFLWATWPMLDDARRVLAAWGFRYVTGGSWHKHTVNGKRCMGTGYIMRAYSEPFLVGVRGSPDWRSRSIRNGFDDIRREHSRKPVAMKEAIEALLPGPYLELFSREDRPGWTAWGDEAGKFGEAAA